MLIPHIPTVNAVIYSQGNNIALGKPATAMNSLSEKYTPDKVNDGDYNTIWSIGTITDIPWIQIDLKQETRISQVNVHFAKDLDQPETRKGLILMGSNDPEFKTSVTLGTSGNTQFPAYGCWYVQVTDPTKVRYIRVMRTSAEYSVFSEIEIYPDISAETGLADIQEDPYQMEIALFNQIGVMKEKDERIFDPNRPITRAEATEEVLRLFKYDFLSDGVVFADMDEDDPYYPYLATAYYLGILDCMDDGGIHPDAFITLGELNVMLVASLGYEYFLPEDGDKIVNAAVASQKLKLKTGDVNAYLTRSEMADALYRAMQVERQYSYVSNDEKVYDGNGTLMEEVYGLTEREGVVLNNQYAGIFDVEANPNIVRIGKDSFTDPNHFTKNYLGYRISFITNEDNQIVCAALASSNKEMILNADDLMVTDAELSMGKISYFSNESQKIKKVTLSDNAEVFLNGGLCLDFNASDFDIEAGYLKLIDYDNDAKYDVVFIWSGITEVVSVADVSEDGLLIISKSGDTYRFAKDDDTELRMEDADGKIIQGFNTNDVVEIYESEDHKHMYIRATDKKISGVVESVMKDDRTAIMIDGVSYDTNDVFNNESFLIPFGETAEFLFSPSGKISWMTTTRSNGLNYGFLVKHAMESFHGNILLKIFTSGGSFEIFPLADSIALDGVKTSIEQMFELTDCYKPQMIAFKTNTDGKIISLDTEATGNDDIIGEPKKYTDTTHTRYLYNGQILTGQYQLTRFDNQSYVFTIPVLEDGSYAVDTGYENYFQVEKGTLSKLHGSRMEFYTYNQDEYRYSDLFVFPTKVAASGSPIINQVSEWIGTCVIVTKTTKELTESGDFATRVHGRILSSGAETSILVPDDVQFVEMDEAVVYGSGIFDSYLNIRSYGSIPEEYKAKADSLMPGDIVRWRDGGNGIADQFERVFSVEEKPYSKDHEDNFWFASSNNYRDLFAPFRIMYGVAYRLGDGMIGAGASIINPGVDNDEIYELSDTVKIHLFNTSQNKVFDGTVQDLANNMLDNAPNSRIMVVTEHAVLKAIIVYEDFLP